MDTRIVSSPNKQPKQFRQWVNLGAFPTLIAVWHPEINGIQRSETIADFTQFTTQTCGSNSQKPWYIQQLFHCQNPVENL